MNSDLLNIANKLSNPEENPRIEDRYVLSASTSKDRMLQLVDGEILDAGKSGLQTILRDDFQITVFPVLGYDGTQIGVIAYLLNYSEEMSNLATIHWGLYLVQAFYWYSFA